MITSEIDKALFKVFAQQKCGDVTLFNNVVHEVHQIVKDELGKADAELYERIADIHDSENNIGWEGRHSIRVCSLRNLMTIIEERSGDYLP